MNPRARSIQFANGIALLSAVAAVLSAATSIFQVRLASEQVRLSSEVTNQFLIALDANRSRDECADIVDIGHRFLGATEEYFLLAKKNPGSFEVDAKIENAFQLRSELLDRSIRFRMFSSLGAIEKLDEFLEHKIPIALDDVNSLTTDQISKGAYSGHRLLVELALICRENVNEAK